MKKKRFKKLMCLALSAVTAVTMLGCGSTAKTTGGTQSGTTTASSSEGAKKYPKELTIDVFDSQANFQGTQSGWFAKMVKDKFNMKLNIIAPNVAGGGDTVFQTRSANGNLGDLIITNLDKSRLKDLVKANLILDMTKYIGNSSSLQKNKSAIESVSKLADQKGMWAVPSSISNQPATDPCEATDPTNAPSLRWDVYGKVGYPEIGTMNDLLGVLKKMQDAEPKSDSGKKVYAFSLFKDWDGDIMQNAGSLTGLYGYDPLGFCMMKDDGTDYQKVIDSNGKYVQSLKFLFDANQMGLVDPESTTQNFDSVAAKYTDGAVLYSFWPWLGSGQYNSTERMSNGKGFETVAIKDMTSISCGSNPQGDVSNGIMIGSRAKDPQRLADFINWLYSPEGIMAASTQTGGKCGPEGLTWKMQDGKPVLTDFGVKAFVDIDAKLQVPKEWGGGTWKDGISALNYNAVGVVDTDEKTGMCYNYQRWDDYQSKVKTKLSEDWSAHNDNATSALQYLKSKNLIIVKPGTNYAIPEYSTDISTTKEQCKQTIVQYSWEMVFAKDENEFNSLLKKMQDEVIGLGFDNVYKVDLQNAKDKMAAYEEASKAK